MSNTPHRALIAGLASMKPVTLRGQEYTGPYLSTMLAINPENPTEESSRTARLISELGRLAATAYYEKQMEETRYRVWREQTIHELTLHPDALETAKNMGAIADDAKKPMTKTAAEGFMRTQPEYMDHQKQQLEAEETWSTLHSAYEAALSRQRAVWGFVRSGSGTPDRGTTTNTPTAEDDNEYHGGYLGDDEEPLNDLEDQAASGQRTKLPAPPPVPAPPPGAANQPPPTTTRRAPPPPPKK